VSSIEHWSVLFNSGNKSLDCYLITQTNEISSGRDQVQRAVVILYPVNGIAEFQGRYTNQACYKPGIISSEYGKSSISPGYFIPFSLLILRHSGRWAFDSQ